jgi:triacylglycerol lipase
MQMRLGVIKASLPIGPFHLVGHSQGGLEARLVAADPAYRGRVLSVTSINSPHAGTSLAEWGSRMFPEDQTLQMLTPEHCLPFMRKMAPDQKETAYFSIQTAIKKPHLLNSWPIFWPCYKYISHREGENDGFVPLSSSEHGEVILRDYGDHVAPIALPFGWRAHDLSKRVFRTIFERIIKEKL